MTSESDTTSREPSVLTLRERGPRRTHLLHDRPLHGGDPIQLCFSGGWVTGRYEWPGGDAPPRFHFSVELTGGRVWESCFDLPDGALLRWPDR
jgi:hypothetical protein